MTSGDAAADFTYGHTYEATESMPETCNGNPDDIWYRFTATATHHTIVCSSTGDPTAIKVEAFSGSCGTLTSIACEYGTPNVSLSELVIGNTYFIRTYGNTEFASVRIAVLEPVPNDDCAGAIPLSFNTLDDYAPTELTGTFLATDGTGTCATTRDLWYRFTAAHTSAGFVAAGTRAWPGCF
ncbi:MAG: hypothetical protein IPN44_05025 [Flavobacteriales bacterium]|nr:hypothetical protein [Flavobacteriales bacterium]